MIEMTPMQVRVLGALIEKKETTPDQYPLSLNALRNACNQKTARHPVTAYTEGEVGHTVRELESMGMVREIWGARVPRYEHQAGRTLAQTGKSLALLCTLMLRGPQTCGELRTNAQRLYEFSDLEDVQRVLQRLSGPESPLVMALPRQPGQKEERYAHLLCGEPEAPADCAPPVPAGLAQRVDVLESAVRELAARVAALEGQPARKP
jgi:uncharacterized protein YceH (UPF0502 family)